MVTDEDIYIEIAAALGWQDDMTYEETASDAAEIEEGKEVLGF